MATDLIATKKYLLETARLIVPTRRVLFYEVDDRQQPFGHISSSTEQYWGELYSKFINLDPFHPRHFSQRPGNVFGTAPGFCVDAENEEYMSGFRFMLGIRYKAEVFLRDAHGRIRAGLRYLRFEGDSEFTTEEMGQLAKTQLLFATTWCATLSQAKEAGILGGLTEREHEVMRLLLSGYPNREIANLLSIALPTVKNHVKNILNKTGYANRTELLAALFQASHDLRAQY